MGTGFSPRLFGAYLYPLLQVYLELGALKLLGILDICLDGSTQGAYAVVYMLAKILEVVGGVVSSIGDIRLGLLDVVVGEALFGGLGDAFDIVIGVNGVNGGITASGAARGGQANNSQNDEERASHHGIPPEERTLRDGQPNHYTGDTHAVKTVFGIFE